MTKFPADVWKVERKMLGVMLCLYHLTPLQGLTLPPVTTRVGK